MNQYYHKLMDSYPDSLLKAKEEARKYLKKDYKKTRKESTWQRHGEHSKIVVQSCFFGVQ